MAKTAHLDIRADHLDMVKRILSNQLHTDYHVWVYGSRATWQAKDHSDLDLAIAQKNGEKTPYPTLAALETDFEESDLPWKVDVVDWHSLNTDFKQAIQQQRVSLQWGTEEKTQVDSRGGVMSVDWPQFQLGERCTVKSSKRIFAHEYVDDGIPFMRSKDVIDKALGAFLGYDLYISEERFLEIKKTHGSPKFGDLLMSFVGNRSGHPYVIQNEGDFHFKDGNILWLSEFKDINPDFLAYWLKSQIGQAALASVMIGSAQKALTIDSIRKLWLRFPPLKNQDSIVKILLGLDNKIELNRQTNQTLENIAQAIFKSWFVDFDPTRAKIAARENGQDPELAAMASIAGKTIDKLNGLREDQLENLKSTAALFPDKLVESSFGEAPICWNWGEIGNEISIVGGGTPSTKNEEFWDGGNIPWTSPKDMSNLTDKILIDTARKKEGLKKISSGLLPKNTVLMSSRAPVGYLAISKIDVAINQGYIAMKCEKKLTPEYVVQWAESVMDDIKQRASGTTFAEISKKNFKIIPVVVPNEGVLKEYSDIVAGFYDKISENLCETKTLVELRDSLLPKLLSGELSLDVNTAQQKAPA